VDDVFARAIAVNELLRRARRSSEQWEADVARGLRQRTESPVAESGLAPDVEREAWEVVFALCDHYRAAGPSERAAMRERVAPLHDVLRLLNGMPGQAAQWVARTGDPAWVERGLAAAGLEDRAIDYRDTLVGLNALWRAAERAGLDAEKVWHLGQPNESASERND
jgi:hypothetical protein